MDAYQVRKLHGRIPKIKTRHNISFNLTGDVGYGDCLFDHEKAKGTVAIDYGVIIDE